MKRLLIAVLLLLPTLTRAQSTGSSANAYQLNGVLYASQQPGVDATGATDSTTGLQTAITALVGGGTLYIDKGTYALKGASLTTGASSHLTIQCSPKAVLQAQTGFSGTAMLTASASSADTLVQGCLFDGNSLAANAILFGTGATRITVIGNEIKNFTGNSINSTSISAIIVPDPVFTITGNYFHNIVGAGVWIGHNALVYTNYNRLDTVGTGSGNPALDCVGCVYRQAKFNNFINSANNQACLFTFSTDYVDDTDNYFSGCANGIHDDTAAGGTIANNESVNISGSSPDIWCEYCSNVVVTGNTSTNAGGTGITVGSGGSESPLTDQQQMDSFDTSTACGSAPCYVAGTNVTLSTDAADKKEGTGSLVVTTNVSFTTGQLFCFKLSSALAPLAGFWQMWFKPTTNFLQPGDLQITFSQSAACSTSDLVVTNSQQLSQNNWTQLLQYIPRWAAGAGSGFNSFAVSFLTSHASFVFKLDDLEIVRPTIGDSISGNVVNNSVGVAYQYNTAQGGLFSQNFAGYTGSNGRQCFSFTSSSNILFTNNRCNAVNNGFSYTFLTLNGTNFATNVIDVGSVQNVVSSGGTYLSVSGTTSVTGSPTSISVCTNGELALSANWAATGSATVTGVSGTGQTCSWTITTGTTTGANPTVTDTLTNVLPSASIRCWMFIEYGPASTHTAAAGEGFAQTTLSATAPIFTFNGTPTAAGKTYLVVRTCGP